MTTLGFNDSEAMCIEIHLNEEMLKQINKETLSDLGYKPQTQDNVSTTKSTNENQIFSMESGNKTNHNVEMIESTTSAYTAGTNDNKETDINSNRTSVIGDKTEILTVNSPGIESYANPITAPATNVESSFTESEKGEEISADSYSNWTGENENTATDELKYTCEICERGFHIKFSLERHLKFHKKGCKIYYCNICGKDFGQKSHIGYHMTSHTGEKPFKCEQCGIRYGQSCSLSSHIKEVHQGIRPHNCEICGKKYAKIYKLRIHRYQHTGERPVHCKLCNKSFVNNCALKQHMRSHPPFFCPICNECFQEKQKLRIHKYNLHRNPPLVLPKMNGEKEYPFICDVCGRKFTRVGHLKQHMKCQHSSEKPYSCDQCSKRFVTPGYLKHHMIKHSTEKPYVCEQCGKAFNRPGSLKLHAAIHSHLRPHKCKICGKGFALKGHVRLHQTTHLPKKPKKKNTRAKPKKDTNNNSTQSDVDNKSLQANGKKMRLKRNIQSNPRNRIPNDIRKSAKLIEHFKERVKNKGNGVKGQEVKGLLVFGSFKWENGRMVNAPKMKLSSNLHLSAKATNSNDSKINGNIANQNSGSNLEERDRGIKSQAWEEKISDSEASSFTATKTFKAGINTNKTKTNKLNPNLIRTIAEGDPMMLVIKQEPPDDFYFKYPFQGVK